MDSKNNIYKFVGFFSALFYLLIIILKIFEVEDFKILDISIKIIAIFFTPAVYMIFAGLGEILDYIETKKSINPPTINIKDENNEDENEEIQLEIPLDNISIDKLSNDKNLKDAIKDDEEEVDTILDNYNLKKETNAEENAKKEIQNNQEPIIKGNKIQCRYCGKYNKLKRTYCYLCANKLRD